MRFCPFCADENPDDARECVRCGKRMPAGRSSAPAKPAPAAAKVVAPRPAPRSRPLPPPEPKPVEPPPPAPKLAEPPPPKPKLAEPKLAEPPPPKPKLLEPPPPEPPPPEPPPAPVASAPPTPHPRPTAAAPPPTVGKPTLLGIGDLALPEPVAGSPPQPVEPELPKRRGKPMLVSGIAATVPAMPGVDLPSDFKLPGEDDGPTVPTPKLDAADVAPPAAPEKRPTQPPKKNDRPSLFKPAEPPRPMLEPASGPLPLPPPPATMPPRVPASLDRPTFPEAPPAPEPSLGVAEPRPLALSPTPLLPTLALPEMPVGPLTPSVWSSVRYLFPLARAIWARKRAQRSIRLLLVGDQEQLDQVLRDLGRAARESELDTPAIADEMKRVRSQESRRTQADRDLERVAVELGDEEARWTGDEAERKAELGRREVDLSAAEVELRQLGEERRSHEADRARIDAEIRAAEKKVAHATQLAAKADLTPPEKGGGANTAANFRLQADTARAEATGLIPPRDDARSKAEALDGPIDVLTRKIVDQRAELAQKRRELSEATAAHGKTVAGLVGVRSHAEEERAQAEREISQRFVGVGTMLNLNRVDGAQRYRPLYARIDELKNGVNAREAGIVRLETEVRTYDRHAVQTGLIAVGVALGVLAIVAILLAVLHSR